MTYLTYLYPFIFIMMNLYSASFFIKKDSSLLLAPLLIFISLVLYVFSTFGLFKIGLYVIISISLLSFIYSLVKSKFINSYFNNWNTIFIVLVFIFIIIWNQGRYFYQWDEFSHWGLMVKEMFRLDNLYSVNASHLVAHKDYLPIIPLFETFWLKLLGSYYEPAIYQSLQFLGFSYFLSILNKRKMTLLGFILLFSILVIYQGVFDLEDAKFFMTIYLDPILFLTFAYFVYSIFILDNSHSSRFQLILIGSFLVLIKEMGIFLFAIGFAIWFIKRLIYRELLNEWQISLVQWIVPLLFLLSWSIYFSQFDYVGQFSVTQIDLKTFIEIVQGTGGLNWQIEAYHNFLASVSNMNILVKPFELNFYEMVVFFLILSVLLSLSFKEKEKKIFLSISITLILFSFAYAFVMMLLYMFSFGEFEGPRLASNMRYISSYWYGVGAFLLMAWLTSIVNKKHQYYKMIGFIAVILVLFFNPENYQRIAADTNYDNFESYFTEDTTRLRNETEVNSKIYLIAQDKMANYLNIFRYLVNDRIFNTDGFNIGVVKDENDIWTWDNSSDEFIDAIKDYDYIYIYHMNDEFYERFFQIMPSNFYKQDHQLLKIIHEDDSIRFEVLYPN